MAYWLTKKTLQAHSIETLISQMNEIQVMVIVLKAVNRRK